MQLSPYLSFNGHCEQAFKFYEKCLRGKITMMMKYGESPLGEQTDPAWCNKILHATLAFGDQRLSGADPEPQHYRKPQGLSVLLSLSDPAEAERIFATLAENGAVEMPLQQTFWALRFGVLVDQFGTPWIINCEPPA